MDQSEIDAMATEIFDANKSRLTQMLVWFNFLSARIGQEEQKTVLVHGIILVSGNSLKAAQYREITGNSIDRDEIVCCPIMAATPDEIVTEWRKWLGEERMPMLATGQGRPIVTFVGSGLSVNFIDLKQFTENDIQEILRTAAIDMSKEFDVSDPNLPNEFHQLGRGQAAFIKQLRRPRVDAD